MFEHEKIAQKFKRHPHSVKNEGHTEDRTRVAGFRVLCATTTPYDQVVIACITFFLINSRKASASLRISSFLLEELYVILVSSLFSIIDERS